MMEWIAPWTKESTILLLACETTMLVLSLMVLLVGTQTSIHSTLTVRMP